MKILRWIDSLFSKVELGLLVLFLGAMVSLAFAQVVLRNVFGSGFMWGDTIVRHLVLWAGFTGAALVTRDERHISIDALTRFISQRAKRIVASVTSLFAAAVCYFLAGAAWQFLKDEKAAGGELVLSIPTWVALLVIPAGYGLLSFHFLIKVLENALAASTKPAKAT